MTGPDGPAEGEGTPVDPDLADAVEAAFDEARSELSDDPRSQETATAPPSEGGSKERAGGHAPGAPEDAQSPRAEGADDEDAPPSELDQAKAEAAQAVDDLARARADLYNLQQEYQGFVRRSREAAAGHRQAGQALVVEALIPVLDEIELARQHGDLTGSFEAMATKLEGVLGDKFGLERFGRVGEDFDPSCHEALMAVESAEVSGPSISMVLQPGYRLGDKIVRAARVQVANPT